MVIITGCAPRFYEEDMAKPRKTIEGEAKPSARRRVERSRKRFLSGPNPIVRIGLMEEYDRIDFEICGDFTLVDLAGKQILEEVPEEVQWRAVPETTQEARAVYSILTTAFARRDAADKLRRSLSQANHQARVVEVGEEILIDDRLVANNIKYRVLIGRWPTEREAMKHIDQYKDDFAPRVVRQVVRSSSGTIELLYENNSRCELVKDGFRLIPKNEESFVTLFDVREGTGFQWEREIDRNYPGVIEVRIDHRGLLMALVELPLEQYLKGVVPAEMPASYPHEALKAQAIAARSETLAKIGLKHLNDPFDLCAHVHCQAYSGNNHEDGRTAAAVDETCGQVLILNNRIAEAVYSACCGGRTENKLNVWNPPGSSHLEGKWDNCADPEQFDELDLTVEDDVRKWVTSTPSVWCNTTAKDGLPQILVNASRHFRWEVVYSRKELEQIIRRKTGEEIGTLYDIIPLKRGSSGRLMELEIYGSQKILRIQRELNIRNALSMKYLKSACFFIEVDLGEDNRPLNFRFIGAGWGHGVGMCQVGSGMMAFDGKSSKEILTHYYPTTVVEKVYGD